MLDSTNCHAILRTNFGAMIYYYLLPELLEGNKAMYKPCSKFDGKFETKKAVFLCNDGLGHPGQFVYIRDDREEQEYFGLCEVEVFEYRSKWPSSA